MESGSISKEKEVVVDIESDKSHEVQGNNRAMTAGNKREKRSLDMVTSGSGDEETSIKPDGSTSRGSIESPSEAVELLVDKSTEQQPLIKKEHDKERRKGGKVKKAAKPPRPPNGPTLSSSDLRLMKELTEMAMKKRERLERIKQLRKVQASRVSSQSSLSSSHGSTIFAMTITLLFFLLLIFQGFITNTGSGLSPSAAPQPSPETAIQYYKAVLPDDGDGPYSVLSKATEMHSGLDFSSPENDQQM